ncbi:MAG TPA: TrkA family potassium uptake protein [Clostridiales bacterium]|jgi:trk system potassium uptake protein TrkA|nr:TrkA family potassium uptake protein [Clostridiales bacterium]HBL82012.1 TrkA family potassium uptake protein [Clostridiales bacterium]
MNFMRKAEQSHSYGVIGLGRFGKALSLALAASGHELLVIDADEDKIRQLREYTENAFVVKTLDKESLSDTGIQNCDTVVVCIGEKMDVCILTVLYLNALGIQRVIAKANSEEHGEILKKLGAEVVFPEHDMAVRLARRLETSKMINYIELSEKVDISTLCIPEAFIGETIGSVDVRKRFGLNIIAVENPAGVMTELTSDYRFTEEDAIVVIGDREKINALEAKCY